MVRGPQGIFAAIPGLEAMFKALTKVLPLGVAPSSNEDGELFSCIGSTEQPFDSKALVLWGLPPHQQDGCSGVVAVGDRENVPIQFA